MRPVSFLTSLRLAVRWALVMIGFAGEAGWLTNSFHRTPNKLLTPGAGARPRTGNAIMAGKGRSGSKNGKSMDAPKSSVPQKGFLQGLANYGDADFSIYMRRAFARSQGFSLDELSRPVVG